MQINPEHLATEIAKFRDQRRALQEMVIQCFPIGCKVKDRVTGDTGEVRSVVASMPDTLHVTFTFGRTFAVSITDLERYDEPY